MKLNLTFIRFKFHDAFLLLTSIIIYKKNIYAVTIYSYRKYAKKERKSFLKANLIDRYL